MSEAFDLHWDRGWEFYEADKFEAAISEWRLAGKLDPEDGYVLNNIGQALSMLSKKEDAIAEWRKAVQLEPDYDSPHINLAYALSAEGYSPEALAAVRTAICLSPNDAILYNRLGYCLFEQAYESNDQAGYEAAAEAIQQAISIDPANFQSFHSLGVVKWKLGEKRNGIEMIKAAIAVNPSNIKAHIQLSSHQLYTGHFSSAMRTYFAAIRLLKTEDGKQHLADSESLMHNVEISLYTSAGLAAVLVGVWIWSRRRGR